MIHSTEVNAQSPLELATDIVSRICALPAVATQDWCDTASATLNIIRERSITTISLAIIGPQGEITRLEAGGASGVDPNGRPISGDGLHPEHASSFGWWFEGNVGNQKVRSSRLGSLACAEQWANGPCGRRWANLSVHDLAVVTGMMPGPSGRMLVIEFGSTTPGQTIESWELSVLAAVTPHLVRRATMAFGVDTSSPTARLTLREQQILEHLALGKSVKQIATDLARSPHTVHDHVKSLHRKLKASSRGELIARALGHLSSCKPEPLTAGTINVEPKVPTLMSA